MFFSNKNDIYIHFFFFLQNRVLSFRATYCWISFLLLVTNTAKKNLFFYFQNGNISFLNFHLYSLSSYLKDYNLRLVQKKVYPLLNLSLITYNSELIHDTNLTLLKTHWRNVWKAYIGDKRCNRFAKYPKFVCVAYDFAEVNVLAWTIPCYGRVTHLQQIPRRFKV